MFSTFIQPLLKQKWKAELPHGTSKEGTMLVLSRKMNQALVVDDQIRVVVLGIANGAVRIGIDAPNHVPIHRGEVHQRIRKEEQELAQQDLLHGPQEKPSLGDLDAEARRKT